MSDDKLERNKSNVLAFYDLMFNLCQPAEAIQLYAGATYTQHNPHVGDGKRLSLPISNAWPRNIPASACTSNA